MARKRSFGRSPACLAAIAAAALCGCGSPMTPAVPSPPAGWHTGFNLTSYRADALSQPGADLALVRLRRLGVDRLAVVTQWYMDGHTSSEVAPDPDKTPSDASLLHAITAARRLGMAVTLKPHVDLRDGSFRGDIAPSDVASWFGSYDVMVARYARLAARAGASTFVVGVELTSMARHETEFRRVIRTARRAFPGRLTFAANWVQGAEKVHFWDALDIVGIDAYMPLVKGPNPSVRALKRAWRKRYVKRVDRLHKKVGKPILFTELGYQSRAGTAHQPQGVEGPVSQVAQARAYQAAYEVWAHHSGFAGIHWWDWPADDDPVSTSSSSFSPAGKLAERVVRRFSLAGARLR